MSKLELQIKDDNEICLPDWIAASKLTLAEIGAVACLACMETGSGGYKELLTERLGSCEMKEAFEGLELKGVMSAKLVGNSLTMRLDLDAVAPRGA